MRSRIFKLNRTLSVVIHNKHRRTTYGQIVYRAGTYTCTHAKCGILYWDCLSWIAPMFDWPGTFLYVTVPDVLCGTHLCSIILLISLRNDQLDLVDHDTCISSAMNSLLENFDASRIIGCWLYVFALYAKSRFSPPGVVVLTEQRRKKGWAQGMTLNSWQITWF